MLCDLAIFSLDLGVKQVDPQVSEVLFERLSDGRRDFEQVVLGREVLHAVVEFRARDRRPSVRLHLSWLVPPGTS